MILLWTIIVPLGYDITSYDILSTIFSNSSHYIAALDFCNYTDAIQACRDKGMELATIIDQNDVNATVAALAVTGASFVFSWI